VQIEVLENQTRVRRKVKMLDIDINRLTCELKKYNQEHLLQFWELLTDDEKYLLYNDLKNIDYASLLSIFNHSNQNKCNDTCNGVDDEFLEPLDNDTYAGILTSPPETLTKYRDEGKYCLFIFIFSLI
jgi:hypothetical protein